MRKTVTPLGVAVAVKDNDHVNVNVDDREEDLARRGRTVSVRR
jgi:hypothetical protein